MVPRILGFAFSFAFFLVPLIGFGQVLPTIETPLELEVRPTNPRPGDTVIVEAKNIPSQASSVLYVWRINGSIVDQGRGVTGTTFTVAGSGSVTVVAVVASIDGQIVGEKSVAIRPAVIDIVWEGNTYTPPLYRGRPLPTGSSSVTLQAIPEIIQNGVRIAPTNLSYRWFINRAQTPIESGYGKQSITIGTPLFANPFTVAVAVSTQDGTIENRKSVAITPVDPEIVVYENAPLLGTRFDQAVTTQFVLREEEVALEAFPLYVQDTNALNYEWKLNGSVTEEVQETPRMITLRRQGAGSGQFTIEFSMKSLRELFERATIDFLLTF